jgi:hypothetical protein
MEQGSDDEREENWTEDYRAEVQAARDAFTDRKIYWEDIC